MLTCSIESCDSKVRAKSFCVKHYARWKKYGDPHVASSNKDKKPKYLSLKEYLEKSFDIIDDSKCWIWKRSAKKKFGYGNAWWNGKHYNAHRLVYSYYMGEIPYNMNVCHKCDNPICVNPNHMFIGSYLDNNLDRKLKGRNPNTIGQNNPFSKLSESDVIKIKLMIKDGIVCNRIAKKFNITKHAIYKIRDGINWKHVNL